MDGVIIINKPKNMTSHDVVGQLRKILKTKKHNTLSGSFMCFQKPGISYF